jgi:hypothetical protein
MSAFVRIALRYLAAYLVARGLLTEGDGSMLSSDPDLAMLLETGVGFASGAIAEGWYMLARKFGWAK